MFSLNLDGPQKYDKLLSGTFKVAMNGKAQMEVPYNCTPGQPNLFLALGVAKISFCLSFDVFILFLLCGNTNTSKTIDIILYSFCCFSKLCRILILKFEKIIIQMQCRGNECFSTQLYVNTNREYPNGRTVYKHNSTSTSAVRVTKILPFSLRVQRNCILQTFNKMWLCSYVSGYLFIIITYLTTYLLN